MALANYITGGNNPPMVTPQPFFQPQQTVAPQQPVGPFAAGYPVAPSSYGQNFQDPNAMVQGSLAAMLDPNSQFIQGARQRGTELAATRGGINSSIAAGASERAAIDAAGGLAQQSLGIQQTREQQEAADWSSQQNFNRSILGTFATTKFNSSLDMLNSIQAMSLNDPELFTPNVVSGYSNFFQKNMNDIMSRFFGT